MKIAVVGAGLVGCYMGGLLAVHGHDVVFYGRDRIGAVVQEHGLTVSTNKGPLRRVTELQYQTTLDTLVHPPNGAFDYVLVTLKGVQTEAIAPLLRQLPKTTVVVSFQNGVDNASILREQCVGITVVAGMVPYNLVQLPPAHFHQATDGALYIEDVQAVQRLVEALRFSHLPTETTDDISAILHGKLLLNLNNAINALSGQPLKVELGQAGYRSMLANCITEALAVYEAHGIVPTSPSPVPAWTLPYVLRLPDWIFGFAAASMLSIDETARSSMEDDLRHRRKTEIEQINGYIERLGARHNVPTPWISALAALVREAETAGLGSPNWSAQALQGRVDARINRAT